MKYELQDERFPRKFPWAGGLIHLSDYDTLIWKYVFFKKTRTLFEILSIFLL